MQQLPGWRRDDKDGQGQKGKDGARKKRRGREGGRGRAATRELQRRRHRRREGRRRGCTLSAEKARIGSTFSCSDAPSTSTSCRNDA
eukprot:2654651-Rhodomonas_salina.1